MQKFILPLFCFLFLLGACSPVYTTDYRFTTPPTEKGKICANNCLDKMNACTATCKQQESECRHIESLRSENAYLRYVNERRDNGKEVERSQRSFENYRSCSNDCEKSCAYTHRICHVNCGGDVVEHRYCSAFCE